MDNIVLLEASYRQRNDQGFLKMLNELRVGAPSDETMEALEEKLEAQDEEEDANATRLYCLKSKVENYNQFKLSQLKEEVGEESSAKHLFKSVLSAEPWGVKYRKMYEFEKVKYAMNVAKDENDTGSEGGDGRITAAINRFIRRYSHMDKTKEIASLELAKTVPAPEKLYLIPGTRVMLLRNLNVTKKLVHGRRGIVVQINPTTNNPMVRWDTAAPDEPLYEVQRFTWSVPYSQGKLGFSQYPLIYSWAITVHKAQGMTLLSVWIDMGDSFAPGQGYTALSRVTSLKGLHLMGKVKREKLFAHNNVVRYYESIKAYYLEKAKNLEKEKQKIEKRRARLAATLNSVSGAGGTIAVSQPPALVLI